MDRILTLVENPLPVAFQPVGKSHKLRMPDGACRTLCKAEACPEGTSRRFVVIKLLGLPVRLFARYEDHGTHKTFVGQFKNALKADRLSCRRFVSNAFRLAQFALACDLLGVLAPKLKGMPLEGPSIETIRSDC